MPADPTHGIYDYLHTFIKHDDEESLRALEQDCKYWKSSRIHGVFIVLFDRPDGAVLVSKDLKQVYLVLGVAQGLGEVANLVYKNGQPTRGKPYDPPQFHGPLLGSRISTTLINWEGKIVYDGVLLSEHRPTSSILKKAIQAYLHAVDSNSLITTLPKKDVCLPKMETFSFGEYEIVRRQVRHLLDEIKAYPSVSTIWVARRFGYTEKDNPNHIVTLMSREGFRLVPMVHTIELVPSVQEYVDLVHRAASNTHVKPGHVVIDTQSSVDMLRSILQLADIQVGYYPPPSPEESKISDATNPFPRPNIPKCGVCGAKNCADGTCLFICSRCRNEYYCSKDHQKQHWKQHKKVCS